MKGISSKNNSRIITKFNQLLAKNTSFCSVALLFKVKNSNPYEIPSKIERKLMNPSETAK